jgi:hypothetical protein
MKIFFGLFLIAHGWIHGSYLQKRPEQKPGAPVWPFELGHSWLLSPLGVPGGMVKGIGTLLAIVTVAGFTVSGLGWLGVPVLKTWWVPATIVSSIASLLLLLLYWNTMLVLGIVIDAVILYLAVIKNIKPL